MDFGKSPPPFSDVVRRRSCDCGNRMSSVYHDPHPKCSSCIGQECNLNIRCDFCKDWSFERMTRFVNHRESLKMKRKSKQNIRKRSVSDHSQSDGSQQSGVSEQESIVLEHAEPHLDSFRADVTKQIDDFKATVFNMLKASIETIDSRVETRLANVTPRPSANHSQDNFRPISTADPELSGGAGPSYQPL